MRTHNCGELNENFIGQQVTLCGWVFSIRNHKKISFIDLKDRYGITQITIPASNPLFEDVKNIGLQYVLSVNGDVVLRSSENNEISTGKIEIIPKKIEILNQSESMPFDSTIDSFEDIKLKYRYLDIRNSKNLLSNLEMRSKISNLIRKFLIKKKFIEVETPILTKSTPEGARDFLVPSRLQKGQFYALPQSPQLYKQLLMVGGIDKYFQICRCFRDESIRMDRQLEFTQLDLEMSFVNQEDIISTICELIEYVYKKLGLNRPNFCYETYENVMEEYGTDKPFIDRPDTFVWVTDFPLFKVGENGVESEHHPFTSPSSLEHLNSNNHDKLLNIKAKCFDLVYKGIELGSGSIRINKPEIQSRIFEILGLSKEEQEEKFGFLIDAFKYGAPPHGGMALGLDRLVAMICEKTKLSPDIRDFIAFPKSVSGNGLMENCPSPVTPSQLNELSIEIVKKTEKI
jgi:aspartyl-tRNA synthetase